MHKASTALAFAIVSFAASQASAGFEGVSPALNLGDPADPFDSFDAVLRLGMGHDSNVQLAPDVTFFGASTDSLFADAELEAIYRHRINPLFHIGAGLRLEGTAHLDELPFPLRPLYGDHDEYDRIGINPTLFASLQSGGVDIRIAYDFRFEDSSGVSAMGLYAHRLGVSLTRDISPEWRIRGGVSHSWNDYMIVFPDPVDNRDGTLTAFDVGADYYISGGRTVLSANAGVALNRADGNNWDYTSYGASVGARTVLMPRLFLSGELGYQWRDYDGFEAGFVTPPGREEQGIVTAKAKLAYIINQRFSVDLYVSHSSYSSNQPEFEGDQTVFGAGLTTKLY